MIIKHLKRKKVVLVLTSFVLLAYTLSVYHGYQFNFKLQPLKPKPQSEQNTPTQQIYPTGQFEVKERITPTEHLEPTEQLNTNDQPNTNDDLSPKDQFLTELKNNPDYKKNGMNFQPTNPSIPPFNTKILEQLNALFPYDPTAPIPKKVWKMWDVGLDTKDFPQDLRTYHQTWLDTSPEYEYLLRPNSEYASMIQEFYSDIPEIVHAFNILPTVMLKCDFASYLVLFAYGGIYADVDTKLLQPLKDWIPSQQQYLDKPLDLGLLVGIEQHMSNWEKYYPRKVQIEAWTFMARARHPMLADIINKITIETLRREKAGELDAVLAKNFNDNTIIWTGPGRITDGVFDYLNNILQSDFDNFETLIDYDFFVKIQNPVVISDAMVLPVRCVNAGKKHLRTSLDDPLAYIQHVGKGAWKKSGK
ncbi:Initiation-specific alpha-16-mannosyltransferase [Spathaspora sp. JA1]|nr:Initiation-specific alpha-16-mannosyltransferase [Spathaspora sp. JA1]